MQRAAASSRQRFASAFAVITLLGLTLALAELGMWREDRSSSPPNIVLIVIDTLRQDYLGCYGFDGDISPAIDDLASGAVLFENAISAAPWTPPSVASIMTSLHVQAHGLRGLGQPPPKSGGQEGTQSVLALDRSTPTLASSLQQVGYETTAFYGSAWLSPELGLGRGFERYTRIEGTARHAVERVLDYLEQRSAERPLFLYLHLMDVHGPYICNPRDYSLLAPGSSFPPDRKLTDQEYEELRYLKEIPASWPSGELRRTVRFWSTCYAAGIKKLDRELAPLLAALKGQRQLRNTVVVVTSDHGEGLFEHAGAPLNDKASEHGYSLYFHQTRVPLLMRLPNRESAATRISVPVSLVDVMPTLLALARAPSDFPMHGLDLTPLLRGRDAEPRRVFSSAVKHKPRIVAVQGETHKLIWDIPRGSLVLFDILEDPGETTDIAASEPGIVEGMREVARAHLKRAKRDASGKVRTTRLDEKIIEQLRAIGYVE